MRNFATVLPFKLEHAWRMCDVQNTWGAYNLCGNDCQYYKRYSAGDGRTIIMIIIIMIIYLANSRTVYVGLAQARPN